MRWYRYFLMRRRGLELLYQDWDMLLHAINAVAAITLIPVSGLTSTAASS